jgi:Putative peptidoglycan binding domain
MRNLRLFILAVLAIAMTGVVCSYPTASAAPQSSPTPKKKAKKKHASKRELGQKAPTPDRISEIQSALAKGGYYQGDPNGKWDGDTVAALQKFQSSHGIDASGKLDAPTLQKLGLGSDIAGVSAPRVPQPSGSSGVIPQASPSSASPVGTLSTSVSAPNGASGISSNSSTVGTSSALK